jgi:hypothetical protein
LRLHETSPAEYAPTVETAINFYTPEGRAIITAAVENAIRYGTPYELELDLITAKGRRIRIHTTGSADLESGRAMKVYGSFRDITAEKQAEEERRKLHLKMLDAQKLESLGVLAGGIAHDFNNLLTVILANATFARGSGSLNDTRLAHIETAARRAADLCRQMLAYAGHGTFVVERTDLGHVVDETAQLLKVSVSKKARLTVVLAPDLPAIDADVSQLRQIGMNLVIDASEALGDTSGDIRLTTRIARPDSPPGSILHSFDLPPGDWCVSRRRRHRPRQDSGDPRARIRSVFHHKVRRSRTRTGRGAWHRARPPGRAHRRECRRRRHDFPTVFPRSRGRARTRALRARQDRPARPRRHHPPSRRRASGARHRRCVAPAPWLQDGPRRRRP